MPVRVIPTPYGRPATQALHVEIARAKHTSPFSPVAVVVPGNSVGVAARRLLASGELGPISSAGSGLIGVTFLTIYRLAEMLAAPRLAADGRRPVSTPVVAAAVRRVLATDPGPMFRRVATHPATEEALVGAHRELSDLDDVALGVLADQSARARQVVRIHRLVKQHLAPAWYDEHDLMRAACGLVVAGAPLLDELGTVVCHLPQRVSTPSARLLRVLAANNDLAVIVGLTGAAKADAVVVASVERLGGTIPADVDIQPAYGTAVCSVSDADDEVRVVVRGLVDAMRDGVPLERMAVVFGNNEPYARLLHDHLELAGITHNGVSVRTLADSVLGRALLRLLALPDDDYRRDNLFSLLAAVPVLDGHGREVPAVAWERVSRDAGVVGGVSEWTARLEHYRASLPAGDANDDTANATQRKHDRAADLQRFVAELAADLAAAPATWNALSKWVHRLIGRWVGYEDRRSSWSLFEQEAARRVEAAVDRLGGLDAVDANPTLEVFRRSLALELDAARDRVGRLGEGVFVGPAALTLGVEFDRLWVCGLAEGVFPALPGDDPLIADADRCALGDELARRADRVADDQRGLLAALASSHDRVMCFPRGDLRRSTVHVPSRFLLDTVEALSGTRPLGPKLPNAPWCTEVPSFVHGLTHASFPATRHELDVRAALADDPRIAAVPEVARGLDLTRARRSSAFTRFDGNLTRLGSRLEARAPTGTTMSATRLEQWAKCPHAFFTRYVLQVEPVERPEEIVQLTPIDRGNVVHETLDRFLRELVGVGGVGRPWADEHRARLHDILREGFAEVEARGAAGRRLLWDRSCRQLHAQLDLFLDVDGAYRIEHDADTIETELAFGRAGSAHPAVEIKCSDGRTVRMSGSIDRVDRFADGRLAVIDYKSGSPTPYLKMSPADPLLNGQLLQLPIYAHAAHALLGANGDRPIRASYWFVLRDPKNERGYTVDGPIEEALDRALRIIVDGIERGIFVARPPAPGWHMWVECPYCDPDGLGTTDTHRAWRAKQHAPELADYCDLVGADVPAAPA